MAFLLPQRCKPCQHKWLGTRCWHDKLKWGQKGKSRPQPRLAVFLVALLEGGIRTTMLNWEVKGAGLQTLACPLCLSPLMDCDKASDPNSRAEWFIHQSGSWVQHSHISCTQRLTHKLQCAIRTSACANGNVFIWLMCVALKVKKAVQCTRCSHFICVIDCEFTSCQPCETSL